MLALGGGVSGFLKFAHQETGTYSQYTGVEAGRRRRDISIWTGGVIMGKIVLLVSREEIFHTKIAMTHRKKNPGDQEMGASSGQ